MKTKRLFVSGLAMTPEQNGITTAQLLYNVQRSISILQEDEKNLKAELLAELKKQGVKSVKLDDGSMFIRTERATLKVKDEEKAWAWAEQHNALKIDTGVAMEILRRELKMPKFFTKTVTEFLTIKSPSQQVKE